ncbi:hypothetical protein DIPPA_20248 [Diplonema papillatum]|nr:hypothetical protein DIPPA_20248 [Diplonema papillatum]
MPSEVYFYVPNLIGYLRVVLTIVSYYFFFSVPALFLVLYVAAFVLDAADGQAARALGQSSKFGALLDMITDRAATAGFVILLTHLDLDENLIFALVLVSGLDLCSHYARMYASGGIAASHKSTATTRNWFLRTYYNSRLLMGALCVGQDFWYATIYARHFYPKVPLIKEIQMVAFPLMVLKQVCNVIQMAEAMQDVVAVDDKERAKK